MITFDPYRLAEHLHYICELNKEFMDVEGNVIEPTNPEARYFPVYNPAGQLITQQRFLENFYKHNPSYPKDQPWNATIISSMIQADYQRRNP